MPRSDDPDRIHEADLWIPVLIILNNSPNGEMDTSDLIRELRERFSLSKGDEEILPGRQDDKFSQVVRNIKSHKDSKTNPLYKGYMEDIEKGFRITQKGRNLLKGIGRY